MPTFVPKNQCQIMEGKPRFNVTYLKEAIEFLESLPPKAREKVVYNITKSRYVLDKELFKKIGKQ